MDGVRFVVMRERYVGGEGRERLKAEGEGRRKVSEEESWEREPQTFCCSRSGRHDIRSRAVESQRGKNVGDALSYTRRHVRNPRP
jgi:hypothetical protein